MADEALLTASATSLARAIARGELSSEGVVEAHIRKIQEVNPVINAMVADRFDLAREEARSADRLRAQVPMRFLPPLHGVPCTIKESFMLPGMPNTGGLVSRKGQLATREAPTVGRLREAGAIPLGVTNLSELCMWLESNNRVYGRSNNPYDTSRIVGGSSGGEGAIVGAGGSPFGLGADVGGSIRLPAFFNGVFGHKASSGLVPNLGQFPVSHGEGLRMLATGPICRRAEDLWPLMRVLAGPHPDEPSVDHRLQGDPSIVNLRGLRVCVAEHPGALAPAPAQQEAVRRAADALRERGAEVVPAETAWFREAFTLWSQRMSGANDITFHELMGTGGEKPKLAREFYRLARGRSDHTLPALMLAALEKIPGVNPTDLGPVRVRLQEIRHDIARQLGPRGVLLLPTFPRPAPRHNRPMLRFYEAGYTGLFNALEMPATQIPCGLDPEGLPTGVQAVGRHGDDAVTIAVAVALEEALGGWIPPWEAGARC